MRSFCYRCIGTFPHLGSFDGSEAVGRDDRLINFALPYPPKPTNHRHPAEFPHSILICRVQVPALENHTAQKHVPDAYMSTAPRGVFNTVGGVRDPQRVLDLHGAESGELMQTARF